jgi:hypothetical protein
VPQNCINEAAHILITGINNTVTDAGVVLIPIPVVLKLKLPLRQRIVCAVLFGVGFIVCIAAAFRMYFIYEMNINYDKTWWAYPSVIAGTLELYLGIVSNCSICDLLRGGIPNCLNRLRRRSLLSRQS